MRARLTSPDLRIWLFSAGLAATSAALWQRAPALPELEPHLWWPLLATVFVLTERFAVHLPFGRDNLSLTLTQAPMVLGLFFLSADGLVLAALTGLLFANLVVIRKPPIKVVFNVASMAAQVTVAITVFVAVMGSPGGRIDAIGPRAWLAALAAVLAADLLAYAAILTVIRLRRNAWETGSLRRMLAGAIIGTVVVTDLGLVAALVLRTQPAALALLAVAGMLTFLLYRGYHVQRLRFGRLEQLYGFTGAVDRALQDGAVVEVVCAQAAALLRAARAEVHRCDRVTPGAWFGQACQGEVVLLPRGGRGTSYDGLLAAGHRDGMAAPLRENGVIVGVLVVTDRLDDMSTFDRDDARLFETLAGHAGVALANAGLVERVRHAAQATEHMSLHDPLTGLPNRLHFQQRLERRLGDTGSAAVMLMDVDRFKEVNDTLGHDVGDQLLQEVGRRLQRLHAGDTVVARLGGDEFAVLLGGDDVHVEGMVARITRDISEPVRIGGVTLDVTASIGIAATPTDGSSAALLLRRAEVAMYDAKGGLSGVARYSPERDPYSSRRLSIIGDLARALGERTLELHYQPQANPATGQVTGVEALLRWRHPVWGYVSPDEFVPLAEHTGLIRPLTQYVVETAIRQCVAWRDAGTPVLMAVNISARNLLEPDLIDNVARMLVQAGLPAGLLKLEVTESAIVAEPERALVALDRLVALGLSVSLDDFGTGYSSLTRLRSLPVTEVKIDRSFVRDLVAGGEDQAIVRAVISLGHHLGLRVVAEGVEDEATWRALQDLDCDLVQGYYLARPMPAPELSVWLRDRMAAFATRLRSPQPPATGGAAPVRRLGGQ